jgi:hypothetical protein
MFDDGRRGPHATPHMGLTPVPGRVFRQMTQADHQTQDAERDSMIT